MFVRFVYWVDAGVGCIIATVPEATELYWRCIPGRTTLEYFFKTKYIMYTPDLHIGVRLVKTDFYGHKSV
jgi:hypothetical protein